MMMVIIIIIIIIIIILTQQLPLTKRSTAMCETMEDLVAFLTWRFKQSTDIWNFYFEDEDT